MNLEITIKLHDKLRNILIDSGSEEYGDSIIDEICQLFNFPTTIEVETEGEFVNNGSDYQLLDYVFHSFNTDGGSTNIEVRDFNNNFVGEIAGVETCSYEDDKEEIIKFEEILKAWLRVKDLI